MADAEYYTIFIPGGEGVKVFDANKSKVTVTGEAVLKGWRDEHGLLRVPVKSDTGNEETSTVALTKQELNEVLNNVFDLPSIDQTIQYLHASISRFPNATNMDQGNLMW